MDRKTGKVKNASIVPMPTTPYHKIAEELEKPPLWTIIVFFIIAASLIAEMITILTVAVTQG